MHAGSLFNKITGVEGTIEVPGLGSVVGQFESWNLTRDWVKGTKAAWTLRGTLSYMNEPMLKSGLVNKRVTLKMGTKSSIKLCSWQSMEIVGSNIELMGVEQCP